jgi:O-antigen/teichoic acid export membrane protein
MIPPEYHVGLKVVPIVLLGELFFGVYFNLSLWYKLTDQTRWGAYMSTLGFVITIAINVFFIPKYSYMACAWASFFANLIMMIISYVVGQKKYPIPYNLKSAASFFILSMILFGGITVSMMFVSHLWLRLFISAVCILFYLGVIVKKELPLKEWPVIGKYFG